MFAYILMLLLPLLVYFLIILVIHRGWCVVTPKEQGILLGVFFFVFFLILALRAETVGVDLWNYLNKYHMIGSSDFSAIWSNRSNVDIGFGIVNKLMAIIGVSDRMFIVLMALFTTAPIAWLYITESDNWMLTISLFIILPIFSMNFSGYRQAMAIAVVPLQFYFTKKQNILGFLLSVLLAFSFHLTAAFMLLLYPIYQIKIKKIWLLGLIPLMTVLFIFNKQIYSFTAGFLGGKFEERYGTVSDTGAYGMLILFILFAVMSFVMTDETKMDREDFGLRNLLLLTVVLQFFAPVNSIAMRLNYYYLVFIPISVPRMLSLFKVQFRKFALVAEYTMIVAFSGYFLYKAHRGKDVLHIFPYTPFWRVH